jgi:hypothetical protein
MVFDAAVTDWPIHLQGEPAGGRSAEAIVDAVQADRFPGATFVYAIPTAELGYQAGYGGVYHLRVGAGAADPIESRAVVMAATKGDLAIVLTSLSPFRAFAKGHPNPASTFGVICFATIVNSIAWPGEPPP